MTFTNIFQKDRMLLMVHIMCCSQFVPVSAFIGGVASLDMYIKVHVYLVLLPTQGVKHMSAAVRWLITISLITKRSLFKPSDQVLDMSPTNDDWSPCRLVLLKRTPQDVHKRVKYLTTKQLARGVLPALFTGAAKMSSGIWMKLCIETRDPWTRVCNLQNNEQGNLPRVLSHNCIWKSVSEFNWPSDIVPIGIFFMSSSYMKPFVWLSTYQIMEAINYNYI